MILTADYIVIGDGKTVLTDAAVLIQDGKILEVSSSSELITKYPNEGESVGKLGREKSKAEKNEIYDNILQKIKICFIA